MMLVPGEVAEHTDSLLAVAGFADDGVAVPYDGVGSNQERVGSECREISLGFLAGKEDGDVLRT